MSVSNINTVAMAVVEECNFPVSQEEAIEFIRPIMRNFDIANQELIQQTAEAIQMQYESDVVADNGTVLEYNGEVIAVDSNGRKID